VPPAEAAAAIPLTARQQAIPLIAAVMAASGMPRLQAALNRGLDGQRSEGNPGAGLLGPDPETERAQRAGIDGVAVLNRLWRPEQLHYSAALSWRRVAARLAANLASTSAAGIRLPALAEFGPLCSWRWNQASCSEACQDGT
jgi:hypothetical protein